MIVNLTKDEIDYLHVILNSCINIAKDNKDKSQENLRAYLQHDRVTKGLLIKLKIDSNKNKI